MPVGVVACSWHKCFNFAHLVHILNVYSWWVISSKVLSDLMIELFHVQISEFNARSEIQASFVVSELFESLIWIIRRFWLDRWLFFIFRLLPYVYLIAWSVAQHFFKVEVKHMLFNFSKSLNWTSANNNCFFVVDSTKEILFCQWKD